MTLSNARRKAAIHSVNYTQISLGAARQRNYELIPAETQCNLMRMGQPDGVYP